MSNYMDQIFSGTFENVNDDIFGSSGRDSLEKKCHKLEKKLRRRKKKGKNTKKLKKQIRKLRKQIHKIEQQQQMLFAMAQSKSAHSQWWQDMIKESVPKAIEMITAEMYRRSSTPQLPLALPEPQGKR